VYKYCIFYVKMVISLYECTLIKYIYIYVDAYFTFLSPNLFVTMRASKHWLESWNGAREGCQYV
jgi:hypothetical protein